MTIPVFPETRVALKGRKGLIVGIDDVGRATAFLALDGAKLITGTTLYIDGGYHIMD
jgi:NAD(P)-dependent dehydrogenase (short-subunit alcohol dehydrogenase family)